MALTVAECMHAACIGQILWRHMLSQIMLLHKKEQAPIADSLMINCASN